MPLPEQIKPGDVVLTRGTEAVSRAICLMDGSEVSHAALAVGEDALAEVVGEGLRTVTFAQAMDGHDLTVGRALTTPADTGPVLDVARRYLAGHTSYAHQQIVLLAVLCVTRHIPLPLGGRRLVRTVLDQAAAAVNAMAECGRQPMICSEFVYRCHHEARPRAPYALRTADDDTHPDGTLLGWARAHPAVPRLPLPAGPAAGRLAPADAEAALAPLVSAYATALGKARPPGAARSRPGRSFRPERRGTAVVHGRLRHRPAPRRRSGRIRRAPPARAGPGEDQGHGGRAELRHPRRPAAQPLADREAPDARREEEHG
ncbi:hypothetical protein [Streptomyces blastmyceticus]|uniref:hypothetical protein n=1 Tax=Streptomyces blastmyceticus TaxID=68180 RepID=UPI0031D3636D